MEKPTSQTKHELIINRRKDLPRLKRWGSDLFTLLLWACWLYLWRPFFHVLWRIFHLDADDEGLTNNIFDQINTISFLHAIEMLVGTSLLLIIINRVGHYRRKQNNPVYAETDYAAFFRLPENEIQTAKNAQYITVYHDDCGRITQLQPEIKQDGKNLK